MADKTGAIGKYSYLYLGDFLSSTYDSDLLSGLDYGDLDDIMPVKAAIELTEDDTSKDRPNKDRVLRAAQRAESIFDSRVISSYTIPAKDSNGNVPREVVNICLSLWKYFMYSNRGTVPESVLDEYNMTMDYLKDIQRGVAKIVELEMDATDILSGSTDLTFGDTGDVDRSGAIFGDITPEETDSDVSFFV